MKNERFNKIVEDQLERIRSVLVKKADEYNLEEDRLGFFKRSAAFAQETPEQALYGFLLKHLQSITDMVQSGKEYSKDLWHEKITDAMNYLVLLLGLLEDTGRAKEKSGPKPQRVRLVEEKK
jgi:hypothetical protein